MPGCGRAGAAREAELWPYGWRRSRGAGRDRPRPTRRSTRPCGGLAPGVRTGRGANWPGMRALLAAARTRRRCWPGPGLRWIPARSRLLTWKLAAISDRSGGVPVRPGTGPRTRALQREPITAPPGTCTDAQMVDRSLTQADALSRRRGGTSWVAGRRVAMVSRPARAAVRDWVGGPSQPAPGTTAATGSSGHAAGAPHPVPERP